MEDEDLPIQVEKITISGPTLASLLQRFSSSQVGDVDGFLFGHITEPIPSNVLLDDDVEAPTTSSPPPLVANITGYSCSGTICSFYDSLGRLDIPAIRRSLGEQKLIGWFVGRRTTPLRPSMREFTVSASLSSKTLNFNSPSPCIFLLVSTPHQLLIHTLEYKAFQFCRSTTLFEAKTMDVINIGPAFRGHYGAFSPNSPFPWLSSPQQDEKESLMSLKRLNKEQRVLDSFAEGFEVGRLSKLMGNQAANYTSDLEDLYAKMLAKLDGLARLVENTSAMLLQQEHRNRKLRNKFSGLE